MPATRSNTLLFPLTRAAEPVGGDDNAITGNTAEAILKELREIRQVLEKIEKQGGRVAQQPSKPTTAKISIKGKQVMGAENAPVTVVEFADYQCPFCLRFTKTTIPQIIEISVVLPAPFGPSNASISRAAMSRETSFSA